MDRNRFDYYRDLRAKYPSQATCGHPIRKGDQIGWNPSLRPARTVCAACWETWRTENAAADFDERQYGAY